MAFPDESIPKGHCYQRAQITSAQNRKNVVNQELSIANIQNVNANATVNF